jgi:hypothetical protein
LLTKWLPDTKSVVILSLLPNKFLKTIEKAYRMKENAWSSLAKITDKADINTDKNRGTYEAL